MVLVTDILLHALVSGRANLRIEVPIAPGSNLPCLAISPSGKGALQPASSSEFLDHARFAP